MGVGGFVGSALGLAGLGIAGYQARESRKAQKRNLAATERAAREATNRAAAEQRAQARERRKLDRKKPDVASLLRAEGEAARAGAGATVLSNAASTGRNSLLLGGKTSLLGG